MPIGSVVYQASPWIQMNFYPNPGGPAMIQYKTITKSHVAIEKLIDYGSVI
jgi:hypothetical protein